VTMRTPGQDNELVAGFLITEGLIAGRGDVLDMIDCHRGRSHQPGNRLNVLLAPRIALDYSKLTRHVFASSSCGLCGKASIESVHLQFPPLDTDARLSARTISRLSDRMRSAQPTFALTGGLHAAAIFDLRGRPIAIREDVGRHNAVDKAIGHAFLAGRLPLDRHILLVSGRASFEIVQKALAARIPFVCAVSAPSSLAVEFAQASGQTLIGFLRDGGFNIYSRPERVRCAAGATRGRDRGSPTDECD
jgi:FdhD protein